jgi:hypothetical protein
VDNPDLWVGFPIGDVRLLGGKPLAADWGGAPYSCRHTLTADMTRIAASSGSSTVAETTPSNRPPMNLPIIDPAAIANMNDQLFRSTEKL